MNIWAGKLWGGLALATLLSFNVIATTFYVDVNSTNPVSPYTDWSTAATNIQDAVDAASAGDLVLVTNGVYATGGRSWFGSGTNRVTLTNAITLQSVNGPTVTWIVGNQVAGTGLALTSAARCVGMGSMGNGPVLSGFTLTNGEAGWGNYPSGGGVAFLNGTNAGIVTNCVLIGNLATNSAGGGAYRCNLINCQITENSANKGGGACACTLINCTVTSNTAASGPAAFGGGVFGSTTYGASALTNCTVTGNSATGSGGGAYGVLLVNCALDQNSAQFGGGMYAGTANNCLIRSNTVVVISAAAGADGGGAYGALLTNCVLYGNSAAGSGGGAYHVSAYNCTIVSNTASGTGGVGAGYVLYNTIIYHNLGATFPNSSGTKFNNCCTTPANSGVITNEPAFVDLANGDLHLSSNSPCINAGNNSFVTNLMDLDGNPRIVGGTVDIGAYEYQTPSSILSYAWAQQYGLPTDGSADNADTDGDGMNNYGEWKSGTSPTNSASVLQLASPTNSVSGMVVTWQSVSGITYYLQRSSDLAGGFSTLVSNRVGQAGSTSYTDTSATNDGPYFYRVGVQ